jgi:hypothetical protein
MKYIYRYTLWVRNPLMERCTPMQLCQWLVAGRWFYPDTPVSSTNKTNRLNITIVLLKVALNTLNIAKPIYLYEYIIRIFKCKSHWTKKRKNISLLIFTYFSLLRILVCHLEKWYERLICFFYFFYFVSIWSLLIHVIELYIHHVVK